MFMTIQIRCKINPANVKYIDIQALAFEETNKKQSKITVYFTDGMEKAFWYGEDCIYDNKQFKLDVTTINNHGWDKEYYD